MKEILNYPLFQFFQFLLKFSEGPWILEQLLAPSFFASYSEIKNIQLRWWSSLHCIDFILHVHYCSGKYSIHKGWVKPQNSCGLQQLDQNKILSFQILVSFTSLYGCLPLGWSVISDHMIIEHWSLTWDHCVITDLRSQIMIIDWLRSHRSSRQIKRTSRVDLVVLELLQRNTLYLYSPVVSSLNIKVTKIM